MDINIKLSLFPYSLLVSSLNSKYGELLQKKRPKKHFKFRLFSHKSSQILELQSLISHNVCHFPEKRRFIIFIPFQNAYSGNLKSFKMLIYFGIFSFADFSPSLSIRNLER